MAGKVNFEDSMERLEEIVRRLEEEKVPLEESIRLYEEGMKIGKRCRSILEEAEKRIQTLSARMDGDEDDE